MDLLKCYSSTSACQCSCLPAFKQSVFCPELRTPAYGFIVGSLTLEMLSALEIFALMSCPKSRKPVASLANRDMAVFGADAAVGVREIVRNVIFSYFHRLPATEKGFPTDLRSTAYLGCMQPALWFEIFRLARCTPWCTRSTAVGATPRVPCRCLEKLTSLLSSNRN